MIELPGCRLGQRDLADAAARARRQPADVVGDLGQRDGDRLQRARGLDRGVLARPAPRSGCGAGTNGMPGRASPAAAITRSANPGGALSPVPTAVPPRASSASRGFDGRAGARRALLDLLRVARELLPEPDRHRVLQVGAADLDDVVELARLARRAPRPAARAPARAPRAIATIRRDVDRGRDHVVRGLRRR